MFNLFTNSKKLTEHQFTIKQYSRLDFIKRRYKSELLRIKEYYRNRERVTSNSHMLNKLIQLIVPNIELSDINYLKIVSADAIYYARHFGLINNNSFGSYKENMFYNSNSIEVLYYVENYIDILNLKNNWKELVPIKCVYNEDTDLDFYVPYGKKDYTSLHMSVYEVDIIMLMMQYKYWALERIKNNDGISPNTFLTMVVFPNMMDSILNISLFNRFIMLSKGISPDSFKYDHPFHVIDMSYDIDIVLSDIIDDLQYENIYIEQLLSTLFSITEDEQDMLDVLRINKQFFTRQSESILWISRTRYIKELLVFLGAKGLAKNRDNLYYLPAKIRQLENRSASINLPGSLLQNMYNDIGEITRILNAKR